jgi:hypothetical protein
MGQEHRTIKKTPSSKPKLGAAGATIIHVKMKVRERNITK